MVISRKGFTKGETVEFQNYQRCWVRGTVQAYEPASHKVTGPGCTVTETAAPVVHVLAFDSKMRKARVFLLNPKRVRAVKEEA